jgi:peptidoglycan/LPS O-acetylase OafA/YrhL
VARPSSRIIELDALRALAALNLMLFHFTYLYEVKHGFSRPLGITYPYGKYGVQLFFMLSGLVNAFTLLKKSRGTDFLAARLIRICPPFWAVMALNAVLVCCLPLAVSPPTMWQWLANFTIIPNFWGQECIEPVTWTLQIELFFYGWILLWFLSGWLQRPVRTVCWMLAYVVAVQAPLRFGLLPPESWWATVLTALSATLVAPHMPLFLMGVLLNEVRLSTAAGDSTRCRTALWLGIALCAAVFHLVDGRGHNPAVTALFIAVLWRSSLGKVRILRTPVFVFISGISYSLYLLHNNLGTTLIFHMDPWLGPWPALIVTFGLVIGIAYCSTRFFELPLSRYLRTCWESHRAARRPDRPQAAAARWGSNP